MSKSKDTALLVAAIDFGTTFSGYAFSFRHEFDNDPLRVCSSQWTTGSRGAISLKTSTCVLFDPGKEFHSFGYDAEDKYSDLSLDGMHENWYYFRRFKMMLYDSSAVHRTDMLKDENGNELPAIVVFSAAIKYLADHLMRSINNRSCGEIPPEDIKWVLTVPAIWSDAAKQFTREAAERAGIRGDRLVLALEPEAASMFCKFLPVTKMAGMKEEITCFQPGSKYLVLDAGGGTVDITVHEVQKDGSLHELFKANGGPWGGTTVDKEFLQFLERITSFEVLEKFKHEYKEDYNDLLREFEIRKRSVTPELDSRTTFRIPICLHEIFRDLKQDELREAVRRIPDLAGKLTFAGDKLRADPDVVKSFFKKTCETIVKHLQGMFEEPRARDVTSILMVGGFSESPIIHDAVTKAFPNKRVINPHEAGLAVLKGAVIFGHDQKIITQRISKYTYGMSMRTKYDPKVHTEKGLCIYNDEREGAMVRNTFSKLVEAGQPVSPDNPCIGQTAYSPLKGNTGFVLKFFASTKANPKYIDEPESTKLGEVYVDCRDKHGRVGSASVNLVFGNTELEVEAVNSTTKEKTKAYFNFLD